MQWSGVTTVVFAQNRGVARHLAVDLGDDGDVDHTISSFLTFASNGNLLTSVVPGDIDFNGTVDQIVTTTYTY